MNQTLTNPDAMQPAYPDVTNGSDNRSPTNYRATLAQFNVAMNPRYAARNNNTYCNIFLWDGSRALGCEIPHFDLFYVAGPDGKGMLSGHEHNANKVAEWFAAGFAKIVGWKEVTMIDASLRADAGYPTVIIWNNPGGIGHVAWVLPTNAGPIHIAQAGATNFFDEPYYKGFGNVGPLKFYTHD